MNNTMKSDRPSNTLLKKLLPAKRTPFSYWQNLGLRWKLTSILIFAAAMPAVLTTEAISRVTSEKYMENLRSRLSISNRQLETEVADIEQKNRVQVNTLGKILETNRINWEQPDFSTLQEWLADSNLTDAKMSNNFLLITNAEGKTIAQTIYTLDGDLTTYPALADNSESRFIPIKLPTGIDLSDLAILKNLTQTKKSISGVEIFTSNQLQKLGLDKQAWVGIRPQKTKDLPASKLPAPEGTYPIESGKIGLVAMAAYPVYQNNKLVSIVLAGTLLNRNFDAVDRVQKFADKDKDTVVTLFAQDLRIATNVPHIDGKTRSIGTRLSSEVAAAVLDRAQPFRGRALIVDKEYETFYTPIFDHTRQTQPSQAKPVGIYLVGRSIQSIQAALLEQRIIGYAISAAAVLGAGLAAFAVVSTIIRPLRQLAALTKKIQQGDLEVVASVESADEIGQLADSFNHMSSQMKESFEALGQAEKNYRGIFENALEGIFQSSPDGRLLSANPAMAGIFGYDSSTDILTSLTDFRNQVYVHSHERDQFQTLMQEHEQVKNFEFEAYRQDQSVIWVQMDAHAVQSSSGDVLYYEGIIQDISDRKRQDEILEAMVQERTADLATANESIIALNERLKGENLRMGAELNVARQIQMMILPKPEELDNIEGLDIAGYMEPADEVGGDYYDVLHTDGVVTLGIGDVTGHGLESGILMLMTQTAVRTLQEIRETDPVVFLDTLNRTLYKNVQRMNSEKSLTLAIVNYADGKISISGQHEEAIIVRKGGQIERIDTMDLGFPIALDGDISEFISHAIFDLEIGDGIVLYTDGIPEAKDINKVQYQVERLCEVISENWHKSASEIKDDIITDLRRHIGTQKIFDDITLLVLKRQEEATEKV